MSEVLYSCLNSDTDLLHDSWASHPLSLSFFAWIMGTIIKPTVNVVEGLLNTGPAWHTISDKLCNSNSHFYFH